MQRAYLPNPSTAPINPHAGAKGRSTALTTGARRARMVLVGVACFIAGGCLTGNMFADNTVAKQEHSEPQVRYVTVTVAASPAQSDSVAGRGSIPESCARAIASASAIIQQASIVASSTDKHLDLISDAYQAIMLKNTTKLNDAASELRKLDLKMTKNQNAVLISYQSIMDGFATCPLR